MTYAAGGDQAVSNTEAAQVLQLLSTQPQNTNAALLNSILMALKNQNDLKPEIPVVYKYSNSQSYSIQFRYKGVGTTEGIEINVEEVSIATGQAYVFLFHTERLMNIQKAPGVSIGTKFIEVK